MCQFCVQHGEGKVWYKNAKSYARQMYRVRKEEARAKDRPVDPESQALAIVKEAIMSRSIAPERFPELQRAATKMTQQNIAGQVVPLEEALAIMDIASPIALISCYCRRTTRAKEEKDVESYSCIGLGVGMFKWERWPERYRGGVEFVEAEEAKKFLQKWNKRGMVQTVMTFGVPYIGGVCNCDYPDCWAIRWRLDYGIEMLLKGEYVARVDYGKCTGCNLCLPYCQFAALKKEVTTNKVNIDLFKCFGCGLCQTHCPQNAITLTPKASIPALRGVW